MCGIAGAIGPKGSLVGFVPRLDRLARRGPDGTGAASIPLPFADVVLGMTRLAVVGAKERPRLPLRDGQVHLAWNGEIYNWRALRQELGGDLSGGDSTVLLSAWRRWGPAMLDRLNGMFALVIIDPEQGCVFLARDRAGEKPLYLQRASDTLYFASEVKALPGPFDLAPCPDLDVFEFDCLRETPFRNIEILGPGECLLIRRFEDLAAAPTAWWRLPDPTPELTVAAAAEALEPILIDAIKIRIPDEVPAGILVSGGIDSAILQAVAQLGRSYVLYFDGDVDDRPAARLAAGAPPREVTFGREDLERHLDEVAYHLDTPATWTALCHYHLLHKMAAENCVVVLTGDGADELFGGYARYVALRYLDLCRADQRLAAYAPLLAALLGDPMGILARVLDRSPGGRARARAREIAARFAHGASLVEDIGRVEFHTTMQVLLRMADRMAARFSMENRSPFLDHRVIELSTRLLPEARVSDTESKPVLREVARRLGVPRVITDASTKRGISVPWPLWYGAVGGGRGAWDRGRFFQMMTSSWLRAIDRFNGIMEAA